MKEYNDYVQTTKQYLRHYVEFKATVANLNDEIMAQEQLLGLQPAAPVPKYGDDTSGGQGELTPIEAAAEKRIEASKRLEQKRKEVEQIQRTVRKIDRALDTLTEQERSLIEGHYFNKLSWLSLATRFYVSEKWASKVANRVIKRMAEMIFGNVAVPSQQSLFVFLE